jgi:GPH family glycoside/pentoside/hexuronide:cation symporter
VSNSSSQVAETTEKEEKLPFLTKFSYAMGGTTDIFGHWLYNGLVNPVFVTFYGMTPTAVSAAVGSTRLVDAFTDLFFGWLSDNTRSKWGRRRPYILVGSILAGLALPCLFMVPSGWNQSQIFWFMLISAALYAPIISAYNMPYQSLGSELTPSYHERTNVMSWKAYTQKLSGMVTGAGFSFATLAMFNDATGKPDVARGATWFAAICGAVMILSGLMNFFYVRERYYQKARDQAKIQFFKVFSETFTCKPYLVLLGITLVYAIPTGLVGSFGYYATTYYVCPNDLHQAANINTWAGVSYALMGVAGVPVAAGFSRKYGKKWALMYTLCAGLFAFASSWWLYTPQHPWLAVFCNGLNGFSATGLWVVLPSMAADVVDFDELRSGKRLEGAFQASFTWVLKVGMSASMFIVGPILDNVTGFDSKLEGHQAPETLWWIRVLFAGIPVTALLLALVFLQFFPLTPAKMAEIRAQLEARRGQV